jgi:drug/metabolite transporter (DMT)-like permease
MAVLLALLAALGYGLSDFLGGLVARRTSVWPTAVVGQLSAGLCTAVVAALLPGDPQAADFAWALLAGVGGGLGVGFLYRGFAAGRMSVVGPISAVGAAVVPVLAGVLGAERPSWLVWAGIVLALPGVWLVATPAPDALQQAQAPAPARIEAGVDSGLVDGLLAGAGFGVLFAAIGQIPASSGAWPLAAAQLAGVPVVVVLALALRAAWVPADRRVGWVVLVGPLGAGAALAFMLSAQRGYLAVAGVLTSLYPATTVLLAAVLLHERIHRAQGLGLGLCGAAVVLVAGG